MDFSVGIGPLDVFIRLLVVVVKLVIVSLHWLGLVDEVVSNLEVDVKTDEDDELVVIVFAVKLAMLEELAVGIQESQNSWTQTCSGYNQQIHL